MTKYFSYQVGENCALSSETISPTNQVFIYPNPADKEVFVSVSQGSIDKLELYTISGVKIKDAIPMIVSKWMNSQGGLYLIKVYREGQHSFHRVVVE